MNKRITKITVETREVLLMYGYGGLRKNYCPRCKKPAPMLTIEALAGADLDPEAVRQQTTGEGLHLVETSGGLTFLCLNSLLKSQAKG